MRKHIPILLGLGLLLSGCATTSPLKQYYSDFCKEDKVTKAFRNVTPKILLSKHIAADIQKRRLAGESLLGVMEMTVAQPPSPAQRSVRAGAPKANSYHCKKTLYVQDS